MTAKLTEPIKTGAPSFMGAPACADIDELSGGFAVIGAPFGVPYDIRKVHYGASEAPDVIRTVSHRYGDMLDRYDFDLGGEPFDSLDHPVRDLGNVSADLRDLAANSLRVSEVVGLVLERGSTPIVLGGDDSTSWMSIRGFQDQKPMTVVQIDAHIDFRDEVNGTPDGYSSPMRRASQADWVEKIVHVGIRGPGSARREDYQATLDAGNAIVRARDVRAKGIATIFEHISPNSRIYITLDVDGLDPSVAPGTSAPLPGGLDFIDVQDLFMLLAKEHNIVGMNVAEHYPSLDVNGITSLVITRLIASWIGTQIRKTP